MPHDPITFTPRQADTPSKSSLKPKDKHKHTRTSDTSATSGTLASPYPAQSHGILAPAISAPPTHAPAASTVEDGAPRLKAKQLSTDAGLSDWRRAGITCVFQVA